MGRRKQTLFERLERNCIPEPNSGCWLWTGAVDHSGHGVITIWNDDYTESVTTSPHRVAWQLHCGPIPEGQQVLHKCDVPSCINPGHLWLGFHADNMADMAAKGRANGFKPGSKHRRSKLTEEQVCEIRTSKDRGVDLARRFGVCPATICYIRQGIGWKHVKGDSHGE